MWRSPQWWRWGGVCRQCRAGRAHGRNGRAQRAPRARDQAAEDEAQFERGRAVDDRRPPVQAEDGTMVGHNAYAPKRHDKAVDTNESNLQFIGTRTIVSVKWKGIERTAPSGPIPLQVHLDASIHPSSTSPTKTRCFSYVDYGTGSFGIYNANGGLLGELAYVFGKLRGPRIVHCAITHSGIREKAAFKDCKSELHFPLHTPHINEQSAACGLYVWQAPVRGCAHRVGLCDAARCWSTQACRADVGEFRAALRPRCTMRN